MARRARSHVQTNSMGNSPSSPVAAGDANPFGGMSEEEVRALALSYSGYNPELAAPEFSIALESVARAVSARMDHEAYVLENKRLAFFLITDRPRILAERIGATIEPILDNGSRELCGWVLVTGANCTSGYSFALVGTTAADLFKEINAKGVGNEVALVFDPNATERELRYYPRGVCYPEVVQRFSFRTMNFTMPMLDSVLKRL